MHIISGIIRMLLFVIGSCITVPLAWIIRGLTGRVKAAQLFHRMACAVFSIKVQVHGTPREHAATRTVFLSNHVSYLDIVVLGSLIEARIVAKSDVADWPVFGAFGKVQRTIFIERTRAGLDAAEQKIGTALHEGFNVILFGEGTSTDGRHVLPFKAGLLNVMFENDLGVQLQPVAVVINSVGDKSPVDQKVRDTYAWWKPEDTLFPHLWAFACAGGAVVDVHFLDPLNPAQFADRKVLGATANAAVAAVLAS